jgi:pimeloyl-ACP methyl ester carboxylesterase
MNEALVLAHGAFHGPWCWKPTQSLLEKEGIQCVAVDLNRGGLEADRLALQGIVNSLREVGSRVHAIGHSLGCPSVSLLDPESIASATLLAGPVIGDGMPDIAHCTFPDFYSKLIPQQDGRSILSREDARAAFYHRCSDADAEWALDQLRATFVYGPEEASTPLWQAIPVTYVVCEDDRAVRPDFQQASAEQCPYSVRIDSDHSPMLGQPEVLSEIIQAAMARGH